MVLGDIFYHKALDANMEVVDIDSVVEEEKMVRVSIMKFHLSAVQEGKAGILFKISVKHSKLILALFIFVSIKHYNTYL